MLFIMTKKQMAEINNIMTTAGDIQKKNDKKNMIISTSICAGTSLVTAAAATAVTTLTINRKMKKMQHEQAEMIQAFNSNMEGCLTAAYHDGYSLAEEIAEIIKEREAKEAKETEEKTEEKKEETK